LTPAPIVLTTEEFALLQPLAATIAFDQRPTFLAAVAEALAEHPHRGPGSLYRIAAKLQLGFVRTSNRISAEESRASIGLSRSARHLPAHANVRQGKARWY
jgi:hypothetical protein